MTSPDSGPALVAPRRDIPDSGPGRRRSVTSSDSGHGTRAGSTVRRLAVGGIVGPTAFVSAWAIGAVVNDRHLTVVDDAISQLANVESNTRWLMTAGFVAFGVGVGMFASAVRTTLDTLTSIALGATALSTLAVATLPLGRSDTVDGLHGVVAGIGYVTLALAPVAASRSLRRLGRHGLATTGLAAAAVSAIALGASLTSAPTGLFQRVGLTTVDIGIVVVATLVARGRLAIIDGDGPADTSDR